MLSNYDWRHRAWNYGMMAEAVERDIRSADSDSEADKLKRLSGHLRDSAAICVQAAEDLERGMLHLEVY